MLVLQCLEVGIEFQTLCTRRARQDHEIGDTGHLPYLCYTSLKAFVLQFHALHAFLVSGIRKLGGMDNPKRKESCDNQNRVEQL